MNTICRLIIPETDALMPIRCELKNVENSIQIKCNGDRGFILQIPVDILKIVMQDDLHG